MTHAILHETPRAPHELNPRVPPALGRVCMRMLEKAPEARYADAEALAEALEEAAAPADGPWHVPLFPQSERPLRTARVRGWARGWTWAVLAAGLECLVLLTPAPAPAPRRPPLVVAPIAPREVSPLPPPMSQALSGRKLAPAKATGEVARGARPSRSPTPAPVAKATQCEEDPMIKSKKTLGLAAAALVTGSACVSGPQLRDPPPADCPPGHEETNKRFDLRVGMLRGMRVIPYHQGPNRFVPVSQGPMRVMLVGIHWRGLPEGSIMVGESLIGKKYVYGRFTQVQLPDGETFPICMELVDHPDPDRVRTSGTEKRPGSTPDSATMLNVPDVQVVDRFQ